jgi:hypothetical protein
MEKHILLRYWFCLIELLALRSEQIITKYSNNNDDVKKTNTYDDMRNFD